MFDNDEKPPTFSASYGDPTADNPEAGEVANWAAVDSLALQVTTTPATDSAAELSEVEFTMGDVLSPAIQMTADLLAPNWQITDDESQALGSVWGQVIDVWFPGTAIDPKWAALGLAAATTAVICKSRAGVPLRKPEKKKPTEKEVNASE